MDHDGERPAEEDAARPSAPGVRLQRLPGGGLATAEPSSVRLLREFKGLTVQELVNDLRLSSQLPGRVRSALEHIEQGDLQSADEVMPGGFATVLPGPGHRPNRRRLAMWLVLSAAVLAALALLARMIT